MTDATEFAAVIRQALRLSALMLTKTSNNRANSGKEEAFALATILVKLGVKLS